MFTGTAHGKNKRFLPISEDPQPSHLSPICPTPIFIQPTTSSAGLLGSREQFFSFDTFCSCGHVACGSRLAGSRSLVLGCPENSVQKGKWKGVL